jgi:CheY-like chemotaxis protein
MHGGRIEVQSEGLGKGSNFIVHIPMLNTESTAQAAPGVALHRRVAGKRILVVDDNHAAADTLAMLLEFDGHRIATAYDGEQALIAAESFYPEIILLDIGMPKLDGYEVAQRIRAEPWGRNTKIIAMSGWAQEKDQQRGREAGFDYHLAKPVDPHELKKLTAANGS